MCEFPFRIECLKLIARRMEKTKAWPEAAPEIKNQPLKLKTRKEILKEVSYPDNRMNNRKNIITL